MPRLSWRFWNTQINRCGSRPRYIAWNLLCESLLIFEIFQISNYKISIDASFLCLRNGGHLLHGKYNYYFYIFSWYHKKIEKIFEGDDNLYVCMSEFR